jgi:hypothetical protein
MYYRIEEGNQDKLILQPEVDSDWISKTIKKFSWDKWSETENRLNEYSASLFDILEEKADELDDEEEFWNRLSVGQKVFYSFLAFEGEVDNGGLFQFFWNKPAHVYSFREVINILKLEELADDYISALKAYEKLSSEISKIKEDLDPDKEGWEDEYYEAYDKIQEKFDAETDAGTNVDEYFYEPGFKILFHEAMCDFIENNRALFVKV